MKAFPMAVVLLIVVSGVVRAASGPFGLEWGMSEKELRKQGIQLESQGLDGPFEVFYTTSLPKNLSIADKYVLIMDSKYKLQKVVVASTYINSDAFGSKGKELFANIKAKLKQKYGTPIREYEKVGVKLYTEPDEYYQCLAYYGCGMWAAVFEDKLHGVNVILELEGVKRGTGYIRLVYEGPKWGNAMDARKKEVSKSDINAL